MKEILIIGHVGAAPKQRISAKGETFYTFNVAVTERDKTTTWVQCIINGERKVMQYIDKGRQVLARGDFRVSVYKDSPTIEMRVDTLELLAKSQTDNAEVTARNSDETPDIY